MSSSLFFASGVVAGVALSGVIAYITNSWYDELRRDPHFSSVSSCRENDLVQGLVGEVVADAENKDKGYERRVRVNYSFANIGDGGSHRNIYNRMCSELKRKHNIIVTGCENSINTHDTIIYQVN